MENGVFQQFLNSKDSSTDKVPIFSDSGKPQNIGLLPRSESTDKRDWKNPQFKPDRAKVLTSAATDIRNFLRADEASTPVENRFDFFALKKTPFKALNNKQPTSERIGADKVCLPKREKINKAKSRRSTPAKHKTAQSLMSVFTPGIPSATAMNVQGRDTDTMSQQQQKATDKRKLSNETEVSGSDLKRNKEIDIKSDDTSQEVIKESEHQRNMPISSHDQRVYKSIDDGITSPDVITHSQQEQLMADPKSLSLEVVFGMFQKLQVDINQLKRQDCSKDVKKLQEQVDQHTEQIRGANFDQLQQQDKIDKILQDLDLFKTKTEIMAGVIQRMDVVMNEQAVKIQRMEADKAKCSIIIKNLYSGPKIIDAKLEVYKLLYEQMQVDVTVNDVYFQANYTPRPIVVVLLNFKHKKRVFGAIKKKAHLKNKDGKKYILQDLYTPEAKDTRNRYQQIFDMYEGDQTQQDKIKVVEKGLAIGAQKYTRKITEPTVHEILKMDLNDIKQFLSVKIGQGKQINEQNSAFLGFTICAQSYEEIRQAYYKLKIVHAGARHIVCAYSIPGQEKHHCNDYCDDGETGAGKLLLNSLMENKITSRAVFVVRYCHGQKIGTIRHKCFAQAAAEAINTNKYNKYTKGSQEMEVQQHPIPYIPTKGKFKSVFKQHTKTAVQKQQQNPSIPSTTEEAQTSEKFQYLHKFNTPLSTFAGFRSAQSTPMTDNNTSLEAEDWSHKNTGQWQQ